MIENFFYLIENYGYIPHKNRIYFLPFSHPPLLTRMISFYLEATNDTEIEKRAGPLLDLEFKMHYAKNTAIINGHKLYTYGNDVSGPRPEAYREDIELTANLSSDNDKENVYAELRAATESGFEFSSRWVINNGSDIGSRIDQKCRSIIPVELNSVLYRNFVTIAEFYRNYGNNIKADEYEQLGADLLAAIEAVLWNEEDGAWYDYDLLNTKQRKTFAVTNLTPIASVAYNTSNTEKYAASIMQYIANNDLDSYLGGLPTTFIDSGEDFDFPNVYPFLEWIIISGLRNLNSNATLQLAQKWALRWLDANYRGYQRDGVLYDNVNNFFFK